MTLSTAPLPRTVIGRRPRRARIEQLLPLLTLAALAAAAVFSLVGGPIRSAVLDTNSAEATWLLRALSVAHVALGLAVFQRIGGRLITPIGVYFLSGAVFLGYGGLAPAASRASVQYLAYTSATLLAFNVIVLVVAVRWLGSAGLRPTATPVDDDGRGAAGRRGGPFPLAPYVVIWAALTLGIDLVRSIPVLGGFADVIQVGISLLLLQAFLSDRRSRGPARVFIGVPAIVVLAVGAFFATSYTGYARIITGAFVIAAATLVNRRYPQLPMKIVVMVGLIPGLMFAGAGDRTGLTFREVAGGIGAARGVTSATGAIPVFALTLEELDSVGLDAYAHRRGRTFLVTALHWVPREWWPTKPNSVEIELARLLYPTAGSGYSIVGSNAAEWVLNFNLPGLVPGAIVTGAFLAVIERWTREPPRRRRPLPHDLVLRALITGNLTIFVWAGSFSFAARTFTPFMMIVGLRRLSRVAKRRTPLPSTASAG